jgi:hypothetical protein
MSKNYYQLNENNAQDIISLAKTCGDAFLKYPMFKLANLIEHLKWKMTKANTSHYILDEAKVWFEEGVDCELLHLGDRQWKKGKLKIKTILEFYPEEPEIENNVSELDDIRQEIGQNN